MDKRKKLKKERNKADKIWKEKTKLFYSNKCAIPKCTNTNMLNCHHIIPKGIKELRTDERNGILLCPLHHKWGTNSAHKNPLWFFIIMERYYPAQLEYLKEQIWKSQSMQF